MKVKTLKIAWDWLFCSVGWQVHWHFKKYYKSLVSLSLNVSLAFSLEVSQAVNLNIHYIWCCLQSYRHYKAAPP